MATDSFKVMMRAARIKTDNVGAGRVCNTVETKKRDESLAHALFSEARTNDARAVDAPDVLPHDPPSTGKPRAKRAARANTQSGKSRAPRKRKLSDADAEKNGATTSAATVYEGGTASSTSVINTLMEQSPLWNKDADDRRPARKRKRSDARRSEVIDRPANLSYHRCWHLFVTMAYCGLRPELSFLNGAWATSSHVPEARQFKKQIEESGASWTEAYQVQDTYGRSTCGFMETLQALAVQNNPTKVPTLYSKMSTYIRMVMGAYSLNVTKSHLDKQLLCAIDGRMCKNNDSITMFHLQKYEPKRDPATSRPDYRYLTPTPGGGYSFPVNSRYEKILIGAWYLYHLPYLIGLNCEAWVERVREMDPDARAKEFPTFASASDGELAQLYVEANRAGCESVMRMIIACATHIEKRNQEYRKKLSPKPDAAEGDNTPLL